MLDLIPQKNEDDIISLKYLEPACGNGNFLVEILSRKLDRVNKKYANKSLKEFEFFTIRALTTIYGIDICPENTSEARERLFWIIKNNFDLNKGSYIPSEGFYELASYVLEKNIVRGDSINHPEEIYITEFKVQGKRFARLKYCFLDIINNKKPSPISTKPYENFLSIGLKLVKKPQLEFEI
jgi:hypothetical protein